MTLARCACIRMRKRDVEELSSEEIAFLVDGYSSGTIPDYLQQFLSLQANAASSATQLQQGQSVVVSTLQQKFDSTSKVNIDTEMSNLIALQNSYAANAHVMSVIQSMMSTLEQIQL